LARLDPAVRYEVTIAKTGWTFGGGLGAAAAGAAIGRGSDETVSRTAAKKFTGYIDLNILKLRAALAGSASAGVNYRFTIRFENEDLGQQWIHSGVHQGRLAAPADVPFVAPPRLSFV